MWEHAPLLLEWWGEWGKGERKMQTKRSSRSLATAHVRERAVALHAHGREVELPARLLGVDEGFDVTGAHPGEAQFATPWGLVADSRMRVLVADTKNRRIVSLQL